MQTEVLSAMPIAVPGMLADLHTDEDGDVVSAFNEEASDEIPFGVMVKGGTADDSVKNLATTADLLKGVVVFANYFDKPIQLGDTGLKPGVAFGLLRRGHIYVRVEDAVTPASEVHVRVTTGGSNGYGDAGAETAGAFRGSDDGGDTIDITAFAKYLTSADVGEIAVVSIDMDNASLSTADS
jgi:hypothetical protein